MAATTKSNVELAEVLYDAFNRGNLDTVMAGMAEDVEWTEPEGQTLSPGTYHGPGEVAAKVFAPITGACDEFEVTPERYIDAGDVVVVEGRFVGTSKTGTSFDIPFVHVCDMEEGLLTRFTNYTDTAEFAHALRT